MIEVSSLVRYARDLIESQAAKKGITVKLDLIPLYVYGNPALLSELVMNLLDNAVKYNRENGQVEVALTKVDDRVVLTVSDTGIGIRGDKQKRIFERFYRAEESRNKDTGGRKINKISDISLNGNKC
ncbi:MAG: HAMP domain-containing sensor histidine kinase [Dialister sp.]|nr:HAMP domain-containing sensor histidine kinase [Dialister sp.]